MNSKVYQATLKINTCIWELDFIKDYLNQINDDLKAELDKVKK